MTDPSATMDREEADECRKMHDIIERHNMNDCFRWIVAQASAARNGLPATLAPLCCPR